MILMGNEVLAGSRIKSRRGLKRGIYRGRNSGARKKHRKDSRA